MKFSTVVAALFAGAAVASPVTLVKRQPRGPRSHHKHIPVNATNIHGAPSNEEDANGTYHTTYTNNWAGAILVGKGYTSVTGTFTVPKPQIPAGGSSTTEYAASAWVGLDGDTCTSAILQTGVDFHVQGSSVTYSPWYEWYPGASHTFSGFAIKAGDVITLTATATSTTSGSVVIENKTTGQHVSQSFSNQAAALCETNAEWIVEDYKSNGNLMPLANFGSVTFSDASVSSTCGPVSSLSGATIFEIVQSNKLVSTASVSGNTVAVKHS